MSERPGCSLCGAPTRVRAIEGIPTLACVSCGAVILEHRGLQQLIQSPAVIEPAPLSAHIPQTSPAPAPAGEMGIRTVLPPPPAAAAPRYALPGDASVLDEIQHELEAEHARALRIRRLTVAAGLITCLVVVLVAIPLSYVVYQAVRAWSFPAQPPPAPIHEPLQDG